MIYYCKIGFLTTVLWLSAGATAQVEVGNGGDVVHCEPTNGELFAGYYALDYVATYNYADRNATIVKLPFTQQLDRIEAQLYLKATSYWASFKIFRANLFLDNVLGVYQWRGHPYGLIDIKDERLVALLPPHCRRPGAEGRPNVIQAVLRERLAGQVIFNFDFNVIEELRPIENQLSYLVVHEWLWNFAPHAGVIREANRLLHSKQLEKLSSNEFQLIWERLGMTILSEAERQNFSGQRSILLRKDAQGIVTPGIEEMTLMNDGNYRLDAFNETPNEMHVEASYEIATNFAALSPGVSLQPTKDSGYPLKMSVRGGIKVMHPRAFNRPDIRIRMKVDSGQ